MCALRVGVPEARLGVLEASLQLALELRVVTRACTRRLGTQTLHCARKLVAVRPELLEALDAVNILFVC